MGNYHSTAVLSGRSCNLKSGKRNQRINQLDLSQSENGVLFCGGRLANAGISQSSRFPHSSSPSHIFTKMVIISEHEKVFHSGTKATLAMVRLNYWIPHGLTKVKRAIKPCLICQRLQRGTFKPPRMAQLPAERVQQSAAFTYTGLDYMGPLMIRDNRAEGHQKRWVAISFRVFPHEQFIWKWSMTAPQKQQSTQS